MRLTNFNLREDVVRKTILKITVILFCLGYVVSCDSDSKRQTSRPGLDQLMQNQAQMILQNELSMFTAGGNASAIQGGGPMGFWFYPPWMYYGVGAGADIVVSDSCTVITYNDTSYYDAVSGYWVYRYTDTNFQWQWRYKFLPHDNEGYPTAETDQYLFDASYSGTYDDQYWGASYSYSGQTDYRISGMKDWVDSTKVGTILFNGNSQSQFTQDYSADTSVTFSYDETIDHVLLKEDDCGPRSGSMNFSMVQNATPDSFSLVYRYDDSTAFEIPYTDFSFSGQTIFTADGVRYIIDGEEYFYEVDCNGGGVTAGIAPKLRLRK